MTTYTETLTSTFKSFDEFCKDGQEDIMEKYRDYLVDDNTWCQLTIESFKEALQVVGFDGVEIYFSGFWSQGDGACFVGNYTYTKGAKSKIEKEFPKDVALKTLAENLQQFQRKEFYQASVDLKHNDRYYHEYSVRVGYSENLKTGNELTYEQDAEFLEICKEFMCHIYSTLRNEYDFQTNEGLKEFFLNNSDSIIFDVEDYEIKYI